jgi:hypothetical protein
MQINKTRLIKQWKYADQIIPLSSGFISNGYGRKYAMQENHELLLKAFAEFELVPKYVEPKFKVFTGIHYLDGAFVHGHKDAAFLGYAHVRCNLMVKKPLEGGNPVIDGIEIPVEVNNLWVCFASEEIHGSTPIKGGERIVISFGGLVSIEQVKPLVDTNVISQASMDKVLA